MVPSPVRAGFRRAARAAWPLALVLPIVGSASYSDFSLDGASAAEGIAQIAPVIIAVLFCGVVNGGVRGAGVAIALGGIAAYCAWWFSLGINANISRYSWYYAGAGLYRWIDYLQGIAFNLWPLLLAAGAVTRRAALKREASVWHALGLLTLVFVVLATPYRASWDDGCNYHAGATPLILVPVTSPLMDIGIGVMPNASSTLIGCGGGDWKPFWQGSDGLPTR